MTAPIERAFIPVCTSQVERHDGSHHLSEPQEYADDSPRFLFAGRAPAVRLIALPPSGAPFA